MLLLLGATLCDATACALPAVARRADGVEQIVRVAAQRGALRCAPEELALARVHLEFARLELAEGDLRRADQHLILAEPNAKVAQRVASDSKCKGSPSQSQQAAFGGAGP